MADEPRPGTTTAPRDEPGNDVPPRVFMPLLDYINAHAMDEDYAHVAERAGTERRPAQIRPGLAALVVMGLFGLLVTTAGVQTARNAGEESGSRASLVTQVKARSAQVDARRARVTNLRQEIDALQTRYLETTGQGRVLSSRLDRLGVATGAIPVAGPGVKVVVDDAPGATGPVEQVLDEDLQKLVNGLWVSGAEAISINGQRLTNLSAIRTAGQAITVNFVSLRRPYTVLAIGDPDTMPARFVETEHGQDWLDLHTVNRLQFTMTSEESLRLPAAPSRRLTVRHATQGEKP